MKSIFHTNISSLSLGTPGERAGVRGQNCLAILPLTLSLSPRVQSEGSVVQLDRLAVCLFVLLGSWLMTANCSRAQSIDGLVKPETYASFEGKAIEIRLTGQREVSVGELQRLVTLRNNNQLVSIEYTVDRRPKKVKPEQIESLKIDFRPYTFRLHSPTKQYLLIDETTARGEVTARLEKRNAQWSDLLVEEKFLAASALAMTKAKQLKETINDNQIKLLEGKTAILLTDFNDQSSPILLKTVDQIIPNLDKMFGVQSSNRFVTNGKVILCAFQSREIFGKLESKGFNNANFGTYSVTFYTPNDMLIVNANDVRSNANLVWHLCWGCSAAYSDRIYTSLPLPAWAKLSIQQTVADTLVPSVVNRDSTKRRVTELLNENASLNGLLTANELVGDRHFIAKHFGQFLAARNKVAYPQFLADIKYGVALEDAIKNAYGESLSDIVVAFGRTFGVSQLKQ